MRYLIFALALWFSTTAMAGPKTLRPVGFVVDGVHFSSIEEWRNSQQYFNMVLLRDVGEKLDDFNTAIDVQASVPDLRLIKRYNKDRTVFGLNHLTKEYEKGAKTTMGWR